MTTSLVNSLLAIVCFKLCYRFFKLLSLYILSRRLISKSESEPGYELLVRCKRRQAWLFNPLCNPGGKRKLCQQAKCIEFYYPKEVKEGQVDFRGNLQIQMQKIGNVVGYSKATQVLQWALKTFALLNVIALAADVIFLIGFGAWGTLAEFRITLMVPRSGEVQVWICSIS